MAKKGKGLRNEAEVSGKELEVLSKEWEVFVKKLKGFQHEFLLFPKKAEGLSKEFLSVGSGSFCIEDDYLSRRCARMKRGFYYLLKQKNPRQSAFICGSTHLFKLNHYYFFYS